MRPPARPLLSALSLTAALLSHAAVAVSDPPRALLRHNAPLRARPAVRPAPAPPVAVQVLGVRPGTERPWGAVAHAIQRDVSPWLYSCYAAAAGPRALAQVEVDVSPQGRVVAARIAMGPARNTELTRCVERAARQLVLPPSDADAPAETDVAGFEVRFGFPRNPQAGR